MHNLLTYYLPLILAIRVGKRVFRRAKEWRYWGYLGAIMVAGFLGRDLSIVFTASQSHARQIEAVTNGVIFSSLLGFSVAYFATTPPPTEAEVLRRIAKRKLAEALVDGSESNEKLMTWHRILENTTDD
ncbi:MAG TPA: hypothetical protein V6D29_13340 [Leptolyngbyaceae cyanobacterium]